MPQLHIRRTHTLGLDQARVLAQRWMEQARSDYGMECGYERGVQHDVVRFERAGVQGTLTVQASSFDLQAELGFLLGAFKARIEEQITRNLDALLQ